MKSIASFVLLAAAANIVAASDLNLSPAGGSFQVKRMRFGSGTPVTVSANGTDTATLIVDGLYHVPNFMPGFPTAATIWPRELPLECDPDAATGTPTCGGYRILPTMGRGEYIFVRPIEKELSPAPVVATPPPERLQATRKKPLG